MSELTLTAAAEDNGSNLTCRAENAEMSLAGAEHRAVKEASLKLNVMCKFYNYQRNFVEFSLNSCESFCLALPRNFVDIQVCPWWYG